MDKLTLESKIKMYQEFCPVGTNVRIIAPIGSTWKDWTVIPVTRKREEVQVPEGWHVLEDVGYITHYDTQSVESLGGLAPIVVAHFIHCQFNEEIWLKELNA